MGLNAGEKIRQGDFINSSAGAGDANKAAKTASDGQIDRTFVAKHVKFGGTGADGALAISSGTTTIDLAGVAVLIKNYTSISITGTGKLAFINPHANGTIIILKSQGDVTLTSSQAPMIDCSGLGGEGGGSASRSSSGNGGGGGGTSGSAGAKLNAPTAGGGGGYNGGSDPSVAGSVGLNISMNTADETKMFDVETNLTLQRYQHAFTGAGGGGGGVYWGSGSGTVTSGAGGRGGGALIIECGGAWNFTTAGGISVAGKNGANSSGTVSTHSVGGGGGGGGGFFQALYNSLTANTGTVTVSGGTGGSGSVSGGAIVTVGAGGGGGGYTDGGAGGTNYASGYSATGGGGGTGKSIVALNTEFA